VFSSKGKLGPVTNGQPLLVTERTAYEEITRNRFPAPLIRKLYDANDPATYDFEQAKAGLCHPLASESLDAVRIAYNLSRASLPRALDRTNCWRIPITGSFTGELVEQTQRRIRQALRARASVILLEIRCSGGDSGKAYELAHFIATINEGRADNPVETIA